MPITENNGGVLKTLGTVTVNEDGVIKTLGSVTANDGGVLHEVFSARKAVVEGITPAVEGKNYIVINRSGTFTLSAPAGARIILSGGGDSGESGYDYDDEDSQYNYYRQTGQASTLRINSTTYNSGSVRNTIETKAGKIGGGGNGGNGGNGAKITSGYLGNGGRGGNGGSPNGSGGKGGVGKRSGDGGSSGNGTPGVSNNTTGGSPGAVGDTPGVYSYGGNGGNGNDGQHGVSARYTGCKGGNGGPGGCVAEYTLPTELINASCILTIGKGGVFTAWDDENEREDTSVNPGKDGGDGVLVIEW